MFSIGLDIGASKMSAGILSNQRLKKVINRATYAQSTQQEVIEQIFNLLDSLVDKQIQSIGIGVPGIVDVDQGVVFEVVNIPSWQEVGLKKVLEKKYKIPVYINNDANCFALGEKYFGQAKKYNNLAAVTLGTGMGTGLIINNQLYNGSTGGAGEFGQVPYQESIMEKYSSGQFFQKNYNINGEILFDKAQKGNKKSLKIFEEFGYHLGKALSIIVYSFDPEIIILGGSVAQAFKFFEKSMKKSLKESSYERSYSRLKISLSDNPHSALLGAAWLSRL